MGEGPIKAAQICTINKYQNELHYNYCLKSLCTAFETQLLIIGMESAFSFNWTLSSVWRGLFIKPPLRLFKWVRAGISVTP